VKKAKDALKKTEKTFTQVFGDYVSHSAPSLPPIEYQGPANVEDIAKDPVEWRRRYPDAVPANIDWNEGLTGDAERWWETGEL